MSYPIALFIFFLGGGRVSFQLLLVDLTAPLNHVSSQSVVLRRLVVSIASKKETKIKRYGF